jgi:hypothetical protein
MHGLRRDNTGGAHHVENPRSKPKQKKNNHSPRGDTKPAVKEPAYGAAKEDRADQLAREPKTAREGRRIGAARRARLGAGIGAAPLACPPQARLEAVVSSRLPLAIMPLARVIAHAFDKWRLRAEAAIFLRRKGGRTILSR